MKPFYCVHAARGATRRFLWRRRDENYADRRLSRSFNVMTATLPVIVLRHIHDHTIYEHKHMHTYITRLPRATRYTTDFLPRFSPIPLRSSTF